MPILTMRLNGLPALPIMRPPRTASAKSEHAVALGHDLCADVLAADRCARRLAQGDMQHGTILGGIDVLAVEHALDAVAQPRVSELGQLLQRFLVDALAGEIHAAARASREKRS